MLLRESLSKLPKAPRCEGAVCSLGEKSVGGSPGAAGYRWTGRGCYSGQVHSMRASSDCTVAYCALPLGRVLLPLPGRARPLVVHGLGSRPPRRPRPCAELGGVEPRGVRHASGRHMGGLRRYIARRLTGRRRAPRLTDDPRGNTRPKTDDTGDGRRRPTTHCPTADERQATDDRPSIGDDRADRRPKTDDRVSFVIRWRAVALARHALVVAAKPTQVAVLSRGEHSFSSARLCSAPLARRCQPSLSDPPRCLVPGALTFHPLACHSAARSAS